MNGLSLQLNEFQFSLLVLTSVMIAGAGYAINDYYDIRTDRINKLSRMVLVVKLRRRRAILVQMLLNSLAILLGTYLAYVVGCFGFIAIYVFATFILWYYSAVLKRKFLIGNISVSLLTSIVVILVWIHEYAAINNTYPNHEIDFSTIHLWVATYAGFCFLISLIREIIKDMEDIKGDKQASCRTIPIVLGIPTCKSIAIVLSVFMFIVIASIQFKYILPNNLDYLLYYSVILLQLPLLAMIITLFKAVNPLGFHRASLFAKVIMLAGIFSCVLVSLTYFKAL